MAGESWLGSTEMAERLGITPQRLGRLVQEHVFDDAERELVRQGPQRHSREYLWPGCRDAYQAYKARTTRGAAAGRGDAATTQAAAKARLATAQAEKAEHELAKIRGEVLGRAYWLREVEGMQSRCGAVTLRVKPAFRTALRDLGVGGRAADDFLDTLTDWLRRELGDAFAGVDVETDPAEAA